MMDGYPKLRKAKSVGSGDNDDDSVGGGDDSCVVWNRINARAKWVFCYIFSRGDEM